MSIQVLVRIPNGGYANMGEAVIRRYPAGDVLIEGFDRIPFYGGRGRLIAVVRDADPADMVALKVWADYVRGLGWAVEAVIPYLPGAREDRGPHLGMRSYAELINSCHFTKVTCLDPHSDVMPSHVDNLFELSAASLIERTGLGAGVWDGIISPDAGASKRAGKVAERLSLPLYQALKHRDPSTGKLSGFWCEPLPDGHYLIVDDICDGGGTFVGLSEIIRRPGITLDLWVTHGAFTADTEGRARLTAAFDTILTTDSFTGPVPEATVVYDILDAAVFRAERLHTTRRSL